MTKRTREELVEEAAVRAGLYEPLTQLPFDLDAPTFVDADTPLDDLRADLETGQPELVISLDRAVELHIGGANRGSGVLVVGTRRVYWWNDALSKGFSFDHKRIIMHAIVSDATQFGAPCIYCQLDTGAAGGDEEEAGEEGSADRSLSDSSDMRLVPKSEDQRTLHRSSLLRSV